MTHAGCARTPLRAVDLVAQHPPARDAVRGHPLPAKATNAAGRNARDEHGVARHEALDTRADFVDHADAFMAQHTAWRGGLHVALDDVQIRAADSGVLEFDDCVRRRLDAWLRALFDVDDAFAFIDESLHTGVACGCESWMLEAGERG
ncbi:predicted protein [Histoplasma capsulatum H143]|uniref:Uncharacterized protein n=1 Tax=Ajellomyces capsulatus (strain H143) TaxID=544712 RepID=C6H667_AJECH|nr:predicted protein [Histoplasma capsulatum H143]